MSLGGRPRNGVADDARRAQEYGTAALEILLHRVASGLTLLLDPMVKVLFRLGDDPDHHVGVLLAAVFGALAHVRTGRIGLKPERRVLPGDEVLLAMQAGDPEAMVDVARLEFKED